MVPTAVCCARASTSLTTRHCSRHPAVYATRPRRSDETRCDVTAGRGGAPLWRPIAGACRPHRCEAWSPYWPGAVHPRAPCAKSTVVDPCACCFQEKGKGKQPGVKCTQGFRSRHDTDHISHVAHQFQSLSITIRSSCCVEGEKQGFDVENVGNLTINLVLMWNNPFIMVFALVKISLLKLAPYFLFLMRFFLCLSGSSTMFAFVL